PIAAARDTCQARMPIHRERPAAARPLTEPITALFPLLRGPCDGLIAAAVQDEGRFRTVLQHHTRIGWTGIRGVPALWRIVDLRFELLEGKALLSCRSICAGCRRCAGARGAAARRGATACRGAATSPAFGLRVLDRHTSPATRETCERAARCENH